MKLIGRIFRSFSFAFFLLISFGGFIILTMSNSLSMLMKPAITFEDLKGKKPVYGMHIKDDIPYSLGCFAYEETWRENNNGKKFNRKTPTYYYIIPAGDIMVALEVKEKDREAMEKLSNETEPTTKVAIDGGVFRMSDDLKELFKESLLDSGYTETEIRAMQLFTINQSSLKYALIYFGIGALFILIALINFILRFRKAGRSIIGNSRSLWSFLL